jgi:Tol biopolymer transport system component
VRLTSNPDDLPVDGAALSPDGRTVAFSDRRGIHIKSPPLDVRTVSLAGTEGFKVTGWFPDNARILATRSQPGSPARDVFEVPLQGGTPRRLDPPGYPSPDGKYNLEFRGRGSIDGEEWWVTNRSGPSRRVIAFPPTALPTHRVWSPDSTRVAFVRLKQGTGTFATQEAGIEVLDIVSGATTVVVPPPKPHRPITAIAWPAPDRILFVHGDEKPGMASSELWEVRVPGGTVRRMTLRHSASLSMMSSSKDGRRLAFLQSDHQSGTLVADLGPGPSIPSSRRLPPDDRGGRPAGWTPDSQTLLMEAGNDWYLQSPESAQPSASAGEARGFSPVITPDGNSVLIVTGLSDVRRIWRAPRSGGARVQIVESESIVGVGCAKAGLCIVEERGEGTNIVSLLDPVRGKGRELLRHNYISPAALSPDGQRLAVIIGGPRVNLIRVLSMSGVVERELVVPDATHIEKPYWSADGQAVYCGEQVKGRGATIWYVPINGTPRRIWSHDGSSTPYAVPSPDGKRLAIFTSWLDRNVWMLERF